MEKKTIGKFIAALRKANGMTQKELGEKLYVSDKTVSRWERDECTPELSLIPAIAEIFGITTDELLRGERRNPDSIDNTERQSAKSDNQFRLILDKNSRKYKNLTLISVGITILGFLAAMIANLAFSKGLIAFCIATAFGVTSQIVQICFAINARIMVDEDDDTYTDRIEKANTAVVKTAVAVSFANLLLFAFCLPLVMVIDGANFGLRFGAWVVYGSLFSAVILSVAYIAYALFVRKILCDRNLMFLSEKQKSEVQWNNFLLKKTVAVSVCIALGIGIGIFVWNCVGAERLTQALTFDTCDDFKAFMEGDFDWWFEEGYGYVDGNGNVIIERPIIGMETDAEYWKEYGEIRNSKGEVICKYYYLPQLYHSILFNESADDKMPVTVITREAYYNTLESFRTMEAVLYYLIAADFVIAALVYLVKIKRR